MHDRAVVRTPKLRTVPARPRCDVQYLGVVPYQRALELQAELVEERAAGLIGDRLLLLEHPHVITLGRNSRDEHVLADREALARRGVGVYECGRGGDVTYHGPGQLVAYPIIDLRPDRCDLRRYVRDLEKVLLLVLQDFGITGHCVPGRTGVWVGPPAYPPDGIPAAAPEAKIAAIGVRVSRWITSHGIALNVETDLRYFDLIVPCGLAGGTVTSLAQLLPKAPWAPWRGRGTHVVNSPWETHGVEEVGARFATRFGDVFGRRMGPLGRA